MLKAYKRNTNIGVGFGWIVLLVANVLRVQHYPLALVIAAYLGGAVLFLWGCGQYAKGKGYSAYWGALGLLYLIGLVILFFMPDRHKAG